MARPMPRVPPVTIAVRDSRSKSLRRGSVVNCHVAFSIGGS
jgi:hypothetical protein